MALPYVIDAGAKGPSERQAATRVGLVKVVRLLSVSGALMLSAVSPMVASASEASIQMGDVTLDPYAMPDAKALWVNPGLYSVHFQDGDYNDENWGLGLEYRLTKDWSVSAGSFKNSDWETSHYFSFYWQPWMLGPIKLGATLGALDGYPNYKDGDWFFAVIPAATYEGKRVGLNVLLVPSYKDRLHGAISFQFKFRLW